MRALRRPSIKKLQLMIRMHRRSKLQLGKAGALKVKGVAFKEAVAVDPVKLSLAVTAPVVFT